MNNILSSLFSAVTRREAEYDRERKQTLSFLGNAFAGEAGEMCNVIKKLERENLGLPGKRSTPQAALDELADVIIYGVVIATRLVPDQDDAEAALIHAIIRKFNNFSHETGSPVLL